MASTGSKQGDDKAQRSDPAARAGEKATSTKTGPGADSGDAKARTQTGAPKAGPRPVARSQGERDVARAGFVEGFDLDEVLGAMDEHQRKQWDELDDNTQTAMARDWERQGVHVGAAGDLRTANDAQVLLPTDEWGGTKGSGAGAEHSEAPEMLEERREAEGRRDA